MSRVRQLSGGGRAVEVDAHRLAGWFDRFVDGHGGASTTHVESRRVRVRACDGAVALVHVAFEPLPTTGDEHPGLAVSTLVEHACRARRIGVVLVRLGAHSVGISAGGKVVESSTDRHPVHGRNKAGGWSQQRFARRRADQARRSLQAAADAVAHVVLPEQDTLDGLVLGGDRKALATLGEDSRLSALLASAESRVLDVPEPRRAVLDEAARRAIAVEVQVHDP
ncbi:acVLRF1 family peptidyl-tRNA hydrolase [Haloactinomyces albus]|uniref:Actinobacteria/chloroflexi VLRF1 release factor domain-containing protein n=1 Tax=Haloactinomyces albus TaxID=1352928 RepID=A0AAE4CPT4_9ACTN|nr:acVLRF1 family peptidyl-tRNA hydrolase [Haloactinomyces albus]MDR7303417.1 hypothetical protein [Haloactinomyces albus]